MDAGTYPQKAVEDFLTDSMIPVRIPFEDPLSQKFTITWTPTLVSLGWKGTEHQRTVGFMEAEELIPSLLLGCAKVYGDLKHFDTASAAIEKILSEHPKSDAAPEALFARGVFGYKSTQNPAPLKEAYEQLLEQYAQSPWTKRAYPYRLL